MGADVFSFLIADRKMDGGYTGYLAIYIVLYIYILYIGPPLLRKYWGRGEEYGRT